MVTRTLEVTVEDDDYEEPEDQIADLEARVLELEDRVADLEGEVVEYEENWNDMDSLLKRIGEL